MMYLTRASLFVKTILTLWWWSRSERTLAGQTHISSCFYSIHQFFSSHFFKLKIAKTSVLVLLSKEVGSHQTCPYLKGKSRTNWNTMTFTGSIRELKCRANHHIKIWRDRLIQKITAETSLHGIKVPGAIN